MYFHCQSISEKVNDRRLPMLTKTTQVLIIYIKLNIKYFNYCLLTILILDSDKKTVDLFYHVCLIF